METELIFYFKSNNFKYEIYKNYVGYADFSAVIRDEESGNGAEVDSYQEAFDFLMKNGLCEEFSQRS